ncbi:hypothetical protein JDV02_008048 [Purpureocillium takamizusanense]|uniref:Uncharacterized protein n=1 Tax=Purpureocillium takamizusanense TaxID=2060973 RepID=A0A9Q8VEQ0_9HYPO|nr:uncharacterized protein JDV02_008048 [Purpureocillium takamizusanense]UNI22129.1 hypothetical protein JDV02_008048 [Purpureocillium takamizusanense]
MMWNYPTLFRCQTNGTFSPFNPTTAHSHRSAEPGQLLIISSTFYPHTRRVADERLAPAAGHLLIMRHFVIAGSGTTHVRRDEGGERETTIRLLACCTARRAAVGRMYLRVMSPGYQHLLH